jgi:hypothetical protein
MAEAIVMSLQARAKLGKKKAEICPAPSPRLPVSAF